MMMKDTQNNSEQAGAELGQAELKLELGFTLIKILNWWLDLYLQ